MPMQNTPAPAPSPLDVFLENKAPAQRAAVLALRFREPRTIEEWRLWFELHVELELWRQRQTTIPPAAPAERQPSRAA